MVPRSLIKVLNKPYGWIVYAYLEKLDYDPTSLMQLIISTIFVKHDRIQLIKFDLYTSIHS